MPALLRAKPVPKSPLTVTAVEPLVTATVKAVVELSRLYQTLKSASVCRKRHGWAEDTDVTMRLVRAMAAGVAAAPGLNAGYDAAGERLLIHPEVHLGIAVDTEGGLFVPVLNDIANRPVDDLKRGLEALKAAVRSRQIPLEHLKGQTITLSNFGTLGGRHAHLAIVPPQVAIAGAGRIVRKVVPDGDGVAVHPVLPMSLTFDHRVVTGGEAARFLMALILDLEKSA